jgi:hypothetical protein
MLYSLCKLVGDMTMTNEEIKQALKLLLETWEKGGQEACEALLAAKKQ